MGGMSNTIYKLQEVYLLASDFARVFTVQTCFDAECADSSITHIEDLYQQLTRCGKYKGTMAVANNAKKTCICTSF